MWLKNYYKYTEIRKMGWFIRTITFNWPDAITLAPFGIYVKEQYLDDMTVIVHESIHWKQQIEMLIIPFYLWYLVEWLIRLPFNRAKAYKSIAFEREAKTNEHNVVYPMTRKHFAWIKYMKA